MNNALDIRLSTTLFNIINIIQEELRLVVVLIQFIEHQMIPEYIRYAKRFLNNTIRRFIPQITTACTTDTTAVIICCAVHTRYGRRICILLITDIARVRVEPVRVRHVCAGVGLGGRVCFVIVEDSFAGEQRLADEVGVGLRVHD